jgi:hypothetical protein
MRGIYRCEDGHLFQRSFKQMIFEANLGTGRHYAKCPVDGKRSLYTRVNRKDLTEDQIVQARARSGN